MEEDLLDEDTNLPIPWRVLFSRWNCPSLGAARPQPELYSSCRESILCGDCDELRRKEKGQEDGEDIFTPPTGGYPLYRIF
jgi:hypothetical protein